MLCRFDSTFPTYYFCICPSAFSPDNPLFLKHGSAAIIFVVLLVIVLGAVMRAGRSKNGAAKKRRGAKIEASPSLSGADE